MPYSIETEDGITIDNIPDNVKPDDPSLKKRVAEIRASSGMAQPTAAPIQEPPELTAGRAAQMFARGATPPLVGAGLGAALGALGGPAAPVTVPIGAVAGSALLPLSDLVASLYNVAAPEQYQVGYPSELAQSALTKLGLPEPQTTTERAIAAGGGAMGGTVGQIGALGQLAKTATTEMGRKVAGALAQQPKAQIVGSVPAGMFSQVVGEKSENPLLALLAGGAAGGVAGAFGGGKGAVPSSAPLKEQASALYRKSSAQGAFVKPQSIQNAGNDIVQKVMNKVVIDPEVDKDAVAVIRRLQTSFDQPQSLEQLDLTRQFLADAKAAGGRSGKFAGNALELWDDYVNNLKIDDIAGAKKPGVALKALQNARSAYAKSKKVETLEDLLSSAELRGEVNYTQAGVEQGIRQKVRALVENPKQMRYFSDTEQKMLRSVAEGGPTQNFLRWVGKVSPSSIPGLAVGTYAAGSLFGPVAGAAVPVIGLGAKAASEALIRSRYENLMRTIAGQPTVSPLVKPAVGAARGVMSAPPLGLLFPYGE